MHQPSSALKPSKRLDLQGIRGLAILAVLAFHFFPEKFPNGYLGVDQFFVLSGFLMCMLLERAKEQSPLELIGLFYTKRFKRILPLYFLLIFLSMLALYTCFPINVTETNQESGFYALFFVSNRPDSEAEDYFQLLSNANIFTHTWSLSVEIQFYFIIPLLFVFSSRYSTNWRRVFYLILGLTSFVFYSTSNDTVAFNSVFARMWQFFIGMLVYLAPSPKTKKNYDFLGCLADEEDPKKWKETEEGGLRSFKFVLSVSLCFITACPFVLPVGLVRPFVTVFTGILMLVSDSDRILSNRILTYIGDISYSLYLIHWPLYAYWKVTNDGDQYKLFFALVSAVGLAIICYETFEKWYLKLSSENIAKIVIVLFLLNGLLVSKDMIRKQFFSRKTNSGRLDGLTDEMTINDAQKMNNDWSYYDKQSFFIDSCVYEGINTQFGWCRHKGLSPKGKYKIAIFGNSWTANHARLFMQECQHKANSVLQGSATGCEPLVPTVGLPKVTDEVCASNFTDFEVRIREEQPDYGFLLTRYITVGQEMADNETVDTIYETMKTQMYKLVDSVKIKLFILDAVPRVWPEKTMQIVPALLNGTDPAEIDRNIIEWDGYDIARKRFARLKEDCGSKCELIDYEPAFFNKTTNTFRFYDERGFSYYTWTYHLSPRGQEHVRHIWTDICGKL